MRTHTDVDHLVPRGDGELPEGLTEPRREVDGRVHVVHEHVEAPLLALHPREERRHLRVVVVVARHPDRGATERLDLGHGLPDGPRDRSGFDRAGREVHDCTRGTEFERDPLADAAAGPGDDRDPSLQWCGHPVILPGGWRAWVSTGMMAAMACE